MSKSETSEWQQQNSDDRPAVGLVDTGNTDAVARAVLRATERGHHVFLLTASQDTEAARYAKTLGGSIVTQTDREANGDMMAELRQVAKKQGYPGVITHQEPAQRIDYAESVQAVWESNDYLVSSATGPTVESNSNILVAIPAYEEAETIDSVVTAARTSADEVVVVDDGSTDETADKARAAGAAVLEHDQNRGYGAALKTIFREADRSDATHLVIIDADGQHDPADIPQLIAHQRDTDAEIVIGSRFADESETDLPPYRRAGLAIVNVLTNLSFGAVRSESRVQDTQSGFRCYSSEAIETLAVDSSVGDNMSASTDILYHAHAQNYDIAEVGITIDYQVENASNHNPLYHGVVLIMNILRTIENERPILILGVPGFVLACVGITFGYLTFSNYIATNTFPVGTAVASVFFTLIGVFAGFTAIILHALQQQFDTHQTSQEYRIES